MRIQVGSAEELLLGEVGAAVECLRLAPSRSDVAAKALALRGQLRRLRPGEGVLAARQKLEKAIVAAGPEGLAEVACDALDPATWYDEAEALVSSLETEDGGEESAAAIGLGGLARRLWRELDDMQLALEEALRLGAESEADLAEAIDECVAFVWDHLEAFADAGAIASAFCEAFDPEVVRSSERVPTLALHELLAEHMAAGGELDPGWRDEEAPAKDVLFVAAILASLRGKRAALAAGSDTSGEHLAALNSTLGQRLELLGPASARVDLRLSFPDLENIRFEVVEPGGSAASSALDGGRVFLRWPNEVELHDEVEGGVALIGLSGDAATRLEAARLEVEGPGGARWQVVHSDRA